MKSSNNLHNKVSEKNQISKTQLLTIKGGGDKRDRPGGGAPPMSNTIRPVTTWDIINIF